MNFKKEYNKLYQHWLKEVENVDLSPLSEEQFHNYKIFRVWVNAKGTEELNEPQLSVKKSYQENVNYLFNDFLKLRESKIINSALSLKEINLEIVSEAEKILFQNTVSTIKGYKKLVDLPIFDDDSIQQSPLLDEEKLEIKKEEKPEIEIEEESGVKKEKILIKEPDVPKIYSKSSETNYNYVLIRFLKPHQERIVGNDLIDYGPFEENTIANLPYENAIILINEKYAEEIELS